MEEREELDAVVKDTEEQKVGWIGVKETGAEEARREFQWVRSERRIRRNRK